MLVTVFNTLEEKEEFNIDATSIKEILSYMKFTKGKEYTDKLITTKYNYVLLDKNNPENPTILSPEVIFSPIEQTHTLLIFPPISGEIPVPFILAAALASATGVSVATASLVLATIGNLLISIALNAVMQALSPTPEFNNDPSQNQAKEKQSSLFNGAPLIREQGGSVPIIFGNPFCGGVLISSGITSEDIV